MLAYHRSVAWLEKQGPEGYWRFLYICRSRMELDTGWSNR